MKKAFIALLVLLAGVATIMIAKHMKSANVSSVTVNGRNTYYLLTLEPSSSILTYDRLPRSDGAITYKTSTDFFRTFLTSGKANAAFFAAPGIHPPQNDDPESFVGDNNAWCIVEDLPTSGDVSDPAIFTRNIQIDYLNQVPRLIDHPPFGQRAGIIVTKGGTAFSLDQAGLTNYFARLRMTNRVLRP